MNNRYLWTLVVALGSVGIAGMLMAERGNGGDLPTRFGSGPATGMDPIEQRVSRALFGALHEQTIESFARQEGFGFSRIAEPQPKHMSLDATLFTLLPPEAAGYEMALIGLEEDADGTVYTVTAVNTELPQPSVQSTTEAGDIVVHAIDANGNLIVDNGQRSVERTPTTELDRAMIGQLAGDDQTPMLIDAAEDTLIVYGAIRASEQRCVACHKCEPDALLGAFRYAFDLSAHDALTEVASLFRTQNHPRP